VATVTVTETPTTLDVTGAAELAVTNTGAASVYVNTQRLRPGQRNTFDTSRPLQVTTQPGQTSTVDTAVAVASGGTTGGGAGTYAPATVGTGDPRELRATPLRTWLAALAKRDTGPADIFALGDSITEGVGVSSKGARWVDLLLTNLRAWAQPAGVSGGEGFVPIAYNLNNFPQRWTTTGTFGTNVFAQSYGPGLRAYQLNGGVAASLTFTGTGCDILYVKGSWGGTMQVAVDGGAATNVAQFNATAADGFRYQGIRGLDPGVPHTVTVTASGVILVAGAVVYNGDETQGVRLVEAGRSGITCASFVTNLAAVQAQVTTLAPSLVLVNLGTNDYNAGTTAAAFQTSLQTLVQGIQTAAPNTSVVLAAGWNPLSSTQAAWQPYRTAVAAVAAATGAAVFDIGARYGDARADTLGLTVDHTHPNAAGHRLYADSLTDFLLPGGATLPAASDAQRFTVSDLGYRSVSYDPRYSSSSGSAPAAGVMVTVRLKLAEALPVGAQVGVELFIATAGATLANSFIGLYDANSGALIGSSADQSTAWQSTNVKDATITLTAAKAAGVDVVVGLLVGSAATMPLFIRGPGQASAGLVSGRSYATRPLFGSAGTALAAPPGDSPCCRRFVERLLRGALLMTATKRA
jgi:lysophospholipase L1-like esterase